jgi:hypothetical protein
MFVLTACGAGPLRGHATSARTTTGSSADTNSTAAPPASTSSTSQTASGVPPTTGTPSTTPPKAPKTAPDTTTVPPTTAPSTVSAAGSDGGLTIELSAEPAHGAVGTAVTVTLQATEAHAPGALGYQLAYGDGSQASNVTNTLCTAGPGAPASQTWTLTHQYAAAGSYTITATVTVNCSPDKATASVTVSPVG